MTPTAPARLVGCLVATLVTLSLGLPPAAAGTPRAAPEDAAATPLQVTIDTLVPSTIPSRGPLTVTGEIINRSADTWSGLNVYLLTSSTPLTTNEELVQAHATDPSAEIGARLTAPRLYDEVDDLEPGERSGYTLSVPRSELDVGAAGVYWVGVHVLGETEAGRVDGADGRARTFVPLMPDDSDRTRVALVLPLREPVVRRRLGRLAGLDRWQGLLSREGRLGRLLDFAGSAGDAPLTWLVDPAVLRAASSVARDNPAISRAADDAGNAGDAGDGGDADDPLLSPSPDVETTPPSAETDEPSSEALTAREWLRRFTDLAGGGTVLTVPYAELDVAAVLRADADDVYAGAVDLAAHTMEQLAVEAQPVVAPLPGRLPEVALTGIDPETPLLLADRSVRGADSGVADLPSGHQAVLTSTAFVDGGPAPGPAHDTLALRQRLLAQAAVRSLSDNPDQPLVVMPPDQWDPGEDWQRALFFSGLDVPWLDLVDVSTATLVPSISDDQVALRYSRRDRSREIPVRNILSTQELAGTGVVLEDLLDRNDRVDEEIGKAAMLTSSVWARGRADRAAVRAGRITRYVQGLMDRVRVESSQYVTLSSEEGIFAVTVINGLDEPVTVGIDVDTGSEELAVTAPDPVSLGPEQRATVRLNVRAVQSGVHSVSLAPVTQGGLLIGEATKVNVRSSQVGLVIWLVMGAGAGVFVVAVALRVRRRVAARRDTRTVGSEQQA